MSTPAWSASNRRCVLFVLGVVCWASGLVAQQAPPAAQTATRHEIVRGLITDTAGKPVPEADVIATRAPDRAYKGTKTDAAGRYVIDWPDGTGDYLVHVAAPGFDSFRKRVTATSVTTGVASSDTVLTVDAQLRVTAPQTLAAVVSTAARAKPTRDPPPLGDPGSNDQTTSGINGVVPPGLAGDLGAIAATIPGVLTTADGPSVMGLSASQNSTTLNGMAFPGADIPRDASTQVKIASSLYDPARGWFSGANTNVELGPGNIFSTRRSHITLDAPALQYTDPISSHLGQRFTNAQLSLGGDGELIADRWYYNYGVQGGRRSATPASLFTADANLLQHAGVSSDSVTRLRSIMATQGIPNGANGAPGSATNDNLSFLLRLDHKPYDAATLGAAPSTWGVTGYGKLGQASRVNASPVGAATDEARNRQAIGMIQADYSAYLGPDYLAFVRSGLTYAHNRSTPYLSLPGAQVLVQSDLAADDGGISALSFGGASGTGTDMTQQSWETSADMQFFARGTPRHRVKLSGDLRLDHYAQDLAANRLGSFLYSSLANVGANAPSAFSRVLNAPATSGGQWNAFLAASDLYRVNPAWQVMYGARLEGNAFTTSPAYNPQVDALFGARTDAAPQSFHVSPRLGFTYNRSRQVRNAVIANPVGRFSSGSSGVLRGGFGEFRSLTPAALLSGATAATGLPDGLTRISCIGGAVPAPDWAAYAQNASAIPTACNNGSTGTFSDAAPAVQLVSPTYQPPTSWRGNLSWYSNLLGLDYTLSGAYSRNLHQPGSLDLNFAGTQDFTLPGENRPMFVSPSDIVPATGLVASSGSRVASQFGRVMENRGDGQSLSRQATLIVSPDLFRRIGQNAYFQVGYTLSSVRALVRGVDGSTFGDPRQREWMRGALDARHQFVVQAGSTFGPLTATLVGHAQSGLPYTPIIGSDVNGDGLANDRAFIPNPNTATDPSIRNGLQALLASPQSSVRDCLSRQLGAAAGAQSCETPWTATFNAQISLAGGSRFLSRRATVNLALVNVLGGVDQLFHGANNLRGWGAMAAPDPVLFSVTGYDAAANHFNYAVNPRFGDTRPTATTARAPFQLTLDVSLDIGTKLEAQQVDRWLSPGRTQPGLKATSSELVRRFARNVPDLFRLILQQSDSLLLTPAQVEALTQAQTHYQAHITKHWTDLADRFAALPDRFNAKEAATQLDDAINAAWVLARDDLQGSLRAILTPVQMNLVPTPVLTLVNTTGPVHMRLFIVGG